VPARTSSSSSQQWVWARSQLELEVRSGNPLTLIPEFSGGPSGVSLHPGQMPVHVLAARCLALVGILAWASGCQSTAPTASPSNPPVLGIDWGRTLGIERPPNFQATVAPDFQQVHPILRFAGQAILADVTETDGTLVAIGYVPPDWTPAAWTSSNSLDWAYHQIDTTAFTFPVALTGGSAGGLVAVGRVCTTLSLGLRPTGPAGNCTRCRFSEGRMRSE
jgi:hypothetical protein